MSGLLRDNLLDEMRTEISWLADAVTLLSDHLNLSSYTLCLLRNHVEPEEARSIERTLFVSFKDFDQLSFETVRTRVQDDFIASTQKPWTLPDELLKELINLKMKELRPQE